MLSPEAAREALAAQRVDDWARRRQEALSDLPRSAREAGLAIVADPWSAGRPKEGRKDIRLEIEGLSDRDRRRLFDALFPELGAHVDRMWQMGPGLPYQLDTLRRAFRAPRSPNVTLPARAEGLFSLVRFLQGYEPDAEWVARWAAYLGYGDPFSRLLAAAIDGGGAEGDRVFEVLIASAEGREEIGAMGRHVTGALLTSSRAEGWDFVERLLLAAQREEGLRQVVLESVDEANPLAFRRMLRTILRHGLTRFSATARAIDAWLALRFPAGDVRRLNELVERVLGYLDDAGARQGAIGSGPAEDAYLALWSAAYEDAPSAIPVASRLLDDDDAERRFVAVHLLDEVGLTTSVAALAPALEDGDLRVAARALDAFTPGIKGAPSDTFERLERLLARIDSATVTLDPILWPWTGRVLRREAVGNALARHLDARPVARLLPHLDSMDARTRAGVAAQLGSGASGARGELRRAMLRLVGDSSGAVREAAISAAGTLRIGDEEALELEGLLVRRAGDLRLGVVVLLLGRGDRAALASADRLLRSGQHGQRLAGLELLRRLVEEDRAVEPARSRAAAYRRGRADLDQDEVAQLDAILGAEETAASLDDALGLVDRQELTPPLVPEERGIELVTRASLEALRDLDELVHAHRNDRIRYDALAEEQEKLLGDADLWFPRPLRHRPFRLRPATADGETPEPDVEAAASRLPLRPLWEGWWQARPDSIRDRDGFELLRSLVVPVKGRSATPPGLPLDPRLAPSLLGKLEGPSLRYPAVVPAVLEWVAILHLPPGAPAFLLDAAETLLARVPPGVLTDGRPPDRWGWHVTWRDRGWTAYLVLARLVRRLRPDEWGRDEQARLWRIERWVQAPTIPARPPGGLRALRGVFRTREPEAPAPSLVRPPLDEVVAAYRAGAASRADVVDHLLGPRGESWGAFRDLETVSGRHLGPALGGLPDLAELVDRCRWRILEVELRRGETPTAASRPALALRHSGGLDVLALLVQALGRRPLIRGWRYDGQGRPTVFSRLIRASFPGQGDSDSPQAFAERMRAAGVGERRLVELAAYAPQWAGHVEAAVGWPGLSSGVWWMHAHTKSTDWTVDQEIREAWAAEVAERTPLTAHDLLDGAVDVDWFRRAHGDLGPKRWDVLDAAAKYCSSSGGHKRAQLFADAARGVVGEEELLERIEGKRHQDAARALGLLPLPDGPGREDVVLARYRALQEFVRTGRRFGSQRRASERRAAEIGLVNLARSAGYRDPVRLSWAMEARGVADLADGPLTVTVEDVEASLRIDERGDPRMAVARGGRVLKALPAAARASPEVKALRGRATELRRRSAGIRSSLEAAMVRGDEFTGAELHELRAHLLLSPRLVRLVLVGDGIAGYPVADGRALQDHAGRHHAVGSTDLLRIGHPVDLLAGGHWHEWQRDCLAREIIQPFKQVFRELYVPTGAELEEPGGSSRYAGHQIQPRTALALLGARGWLAHPEEGIRKVVHEARLSASLWFLEGYGSPAEVESLTLEAVRFHDVRDWSAVPVGDVPPRIFSEVMRDLDLVVSVAHVGGVDPEASASTVEMRAALVEETADLLRLSNVRVDGPWVLIDGQLGEYSVHLGSAVVHRRPGGAVCIVPVHGQHRGRIFLPFADDDPRSAEVLAKVVLLSRDHEIKDPTILEQILMR